MPPGEPGEICVCGPLVMQGYRNLPEQTAETFAGGWLHTGDMAREDEDGFWYIVDRTKDMIVTGGFNVFPREVEDVIAEHPAVAQVGVIGVPDEKWGEAVTARGRAAAGRGAERRVVADELQSARSRTRKGSVQAPKSVDRRRRAAADAARQARQEGAARALLGGRRAEGVTICARAQFASRNKARSSVPSEKIS